MELNNKLCLEVIRFDTILKDSNVNNTILNKYLEIKDEYMKMYKYISDNNNVIERELMLKKAINLDDIEMSLQILLFCELIDYQTYNEMLSEVKNKK